MKPATREDWDEWAGQKAWELMQACAALEGHLKAVTRKSDAEVSR